MVRFGSLELSTLAKWSPKKSRTFLGCCSSKNPIFNGIFKKVRSPGGRGFPVHCGNWMNSTYKRLGPVCSNVLGHVYTSPWKTNVLWPYGAQPFVLEFIEFLQWTRNCRPPRAQTFSTVPLKLGLFKLKTLGIFQVSLGDHFARVESSRDQNLTMFILHFHVFFHFWPPKKVMKIQGFPSPFKTPSPGTMPRW